MTTDRRCALTVNGPVARAAVEAARERFDVEVAHTDTGTVLTLSGADQAALRALMIMLWDSGHEVLAMSTTPGPPLTRGAPPPHGS